ncbi:uncharacterized protein VICG_01043, partial [Vittaforma corneae ATCC 50505]
IFVTAVFTCILVGINSAMISVFGKLRESTADDLDVILFLKYILFSALSYIFESLIEVCSYLCTFFCETFISHWLFAQKMKNDFDEFSKFTPEEQYTNFTIKKEAFVNMVSLVFFSIPMNAILTVFLFYNILASQKDSALKNTILVSCVCLIYCTVSRKAASHRKNLRQAYNDSKMSKNAFCRMALDNYEICTADRQQEVRSKMFRDRVISLASHEYKYFFLSENYRLFTRSSIVALKLLFLFFRMNDESMAVGKILLMIDQLNQSVLRLRNDLFRILEYWNECAASITEHCGADNSRANSDSILSEKEKLSLSSLFIKNQRCITLNSSNEMVVFDKGDGSNKYTHVLVMNRCSKTLVFGQSGCGKSTLLRSLIGIHSSQYEVKIGDADVLSIEKKLLFSNISFLLQKQLIFNKSIEFNLLYGTGLTPKELAEKIAFFNLSQYFEQFEHGLKTTIGSKSCGLSNGQRQMVCFLRCLLRDAPIYIFDDPGIFLDDYSEKLVYSLIFSLSNKIVIVASQSNRHSDLFDQVVKLKDPERTVCTSK